jgi:hypothetical protein
VDTGVLASENHVCTGVLARTPVRSTGLYKSPPDGFFFALFFFPAGFSAAVSAGLGATGFNFASFLSRAACAC